MKTGDKRNSAAGAAGASSFLRVCSPHGEWGFNRSQLLCLTKVWPPPLPSSYYHHRHPPICLSLLPANKSCRREMCCHFSSVPSSPNLRIQLCNAYILLGKRERSYQNNYLSPASFHRRLVFFHVNLQPEWNRLCLEAFFRGTSQRQQLSHKTVKSFSGTLVLPAGLSLGSFNRRSTTNYPKQKNKKNRSEEKMCEPEAVTLIFSHRRHLIKSPMEYIAIWIPAKKTKHPHCICFTTATSRDC